MAECMYCGGEAFKTNGYEHWHQGCIEELGRRMTHFICAKCGVRPAYGNLPFMCVECTIGSPYVGYPPETA